MVQGVVVRGLQNPMPGHEATIRGQGEVRGDEMQYFRVQKGKAKRSCLRSDMYRGAKESRHIGGRFKWSKYEINDAFKTLM